MCSRILGIFTWLGLRNESTAVPLLRSTLPGHRVERLKISIGTSSVVLKLVVFGGLAALAMPVRRGSSDVGVETRWPISGMKL